MNEILTGLSGAVIQTVSAMLTPQILYLAGASLILTNAAKSALIYVNKGPSAEMIWFVIGPGMIMFPAWLIWTSPGVHWFFAACAASLIANGFYAWAFKRFFQHISPAAYERMNAPIDRRKRDRGPGRGKPDRRRG